MSKSLTRLGPRLQTLSLVLPGLVVFTVGLIVPMLISVWYSLTSWDGFTPTLPWAGLDNYVRMLGDENVFHAWVFTLLFTVFNTFIQNVLALVFALVLDSGIRLKKLFRTVLFLPCLIAPLVAGYIWARMFMDVLPAVNTLMGTDINFMLFGNGDTVLMGLLIVNNWQWVGYWMLIYLAGLQSIPTELYEAAKVDGAPGLTQFFRITVPMLAPSITIGVVGITVGSLRVYDLIVSATAGGPGRSSMSIIYQIYNTAFSGRQYGYGSAMSVTLIVLLMAIAVVQLRFLRRREIQQ
jgi:raffinose/stachyose/melibiose transport system permease protein